MDTAQLNSCRDRTRYWGCGEGNGIADDLRLTVNFMEVLVAECKAKDAEIADLKARLRMADFGLRYALVGCINEPSPIIRGVVATDLSKPLDHIPELR